MTALRLGCLRPYTIQSRNKVAITKSHRVIIKELNNKSSNVLDNTCTTVSRLQTLFLVITSLAILTNHIEAAQTSCTAVELPYFLQA
jgi:hypothetical protein